MTKEVLVLGAGIVGVSVAIHLQRRGFQVVLIDRSAPGSGTSFGNAGIIQVDGVVPHPFPQSMPTLMKYARNKSIDVHFHADALARQAGFLARYWCNSRPNAHQAIATKYAPLISRATMEHADLVQAAGCSALIRKSGWLEIFRSTKKRDGTLKAAEKKRAAYGVNFEPIAADRLSVHQPSLQGDFTGAIKWIDAWSVLDPLALTTAYVAYFKRLGGELDEGDALTLRERGSAWRVDTKHGSITAAECVIALGPWSHRLTQLLGYCLPLSIERGYHMHYQAANSAVLNLAICDSDRGYFLVPTLRGVRLTTGVEFADQDAVSTPVQLARAERIARTFFPLGERLLNVPWMGSRPCTPDMMPVIGKAPRHKNLWMAFGHSHHGLTLGPATGRLLAEMMNGDEPAINMDSFAPRRFGP